MALTYTPQTDTSHKLPDFTLKTVEGKNWSSQTIKLAPAKVIVFMCNHCPYVKAIESRLIKLADYCQTNGVTFVGICSNDSKDYPEDEPKELLKTWREGKYNFIYLIDIDQTVAKTFGAVCTPDFFVYDKSNSLVYRGRLDDSWRDESKVTREELKEAIDAILRDIPLSREVSPSMGCSIKWK
ncbi:MAG: hypothetical protein A2Z20_04610 [Bdellovibrionales bacterium RBG_16_40_8]|nr:MAG: hypothetical protein A2Z20_04610 [Bdellovibrionales bacterium RBG_16_40_8]